MHGWNYGLFYRYTNTHANLKLGCLTFPERSIPVSPLILLQLELNQGSAPQFWVHIHPLLLKRGESRIQAFYFNDKMHKLDRAMACGRTVKSLYAFRASMNTENHRWLIKDSGSTSGKRLHLWQYDFIYCCIYIHITKMSPKLLCRDSSLPFTVTIYNPRLAAKAVLGSVHIFRLWVNKNFTALGGKY